MAGVTPEGFTRKTFTQIQSDMQAYLRAKISKHLQLTEKTGLGNVVNSAADQLAELWEVGEFAYYAADKDNADEAAFVALCALTGTARRGAAKGVVNTTCAFDGGTIYPPGGLVAHVAGFPDNRWVNRDTVDTTAGAGSHLVVFLAETAGAKGIAAAGTLTKIAQPVSGWTSITNAIDATPGQDIESLEDLAVRRENELERSGTGPVSATAAAVSQLAGVLDVRWQENKTDYATTLPPHSIRIIVWDGSSPAADDDEIAQAILDSSSGGVQTVGTQSGTAVDKDGTLVTVNFDRATALLIYVSIDVVGSTAGVAAAIVAAGEKLHMGDDVIREKLKGAAAVLDTVNNIATCTLGTSPSPVGTSDIPVAIDQIPLFSASRVVVT
jgi:uncharacterized phage protein gp47/JayE